MKKIKLTKTKKEIEPILLPCIKCKSEGVVEIMPSLKGPFGIWIRCSNCDNVSKYRYQTYVEAVKGWNSENKKEVVKN